MPPRNPRSASPIDKHVGTRVRMRRLLIGMSQEKLAEALGITFQQVQKYEKGANRISASRLFQLATILGVDVSFFLEGAPGRSDVPRPELEFLNSAEGTRLVRALLRISDPAFRKAAVTAVEAIADAQSEMQQSEGASAGRSPQRRPHSGPAFVAP